MITRVIHSAFQLDLSNVKTTHIEENNLLTDKLVSKYTYPIEIDLTPEQIVAFKNINDANSSDFDTVFDVEFYTMGEKHDAVLEIEKMIGKKAFLQIYYGLEEFPNYSKQLSELPLDVFDLESSIFTYAETIINQTYPNVNFNFPQVITDKFDTDSVQWQYFEGIINNYASGDFIINEYDSGNNEQINRNIIQPLPYLLHILVKGFEDAGYTLEGDILTDPDLKKALIYALSEFYTSSNAFQETYTKNTVDADSVINSKGTYTQLVSFTDPGRYKITGNVILRVNPGTDAIAASAFFSYKGFTRWSDGIIINFFEPRYKEKFASFNFNINYTGNEGDLGFVTSQLNYGISQGVGVADVMVFDFTVTQLAKFDASGDLVSTLIVPDKIDLTKCVPEMSFGKLVLDVAKTRNYGLDINGFVVTMSKKKTIIDQSDTAFDLTPFEVESPERNFNKGKSFILGYTDISSDEYAFDKILINREGYQLSPFVKPEDATETIIDIIPLPLKQKGEVLTAHGFLDDNSKAQFVLYDGLDANSLNTTGDPSSFSIINIYLNDFQAFINFLLNSVGFIWSFSSCYEAIQELKIKSIVYAYKQYHMIRKLTRKTISDEIVVTEIETETLE